MLGLLVVGSREAAGQGIGAASDDRLFLAIGFGVESGSSDMSDTKTYTLYDEPATTSTSTTWSSGSFFGGGMDVRLIRNFTVGVHYHQETNTTDTAITGTAPHPVFFNRPRNFESVASGLYRRENAAHLTLGWVVPINPKLDVLVTGGPSFFRLEQDVVSDVAISESGDFSRPVATPSLTTHSRSVTGYNVGADATYIVWQNDSVRLGAGGFVRFTGATTDVHMLTSDVETKVGGLQFGFGGRIRF
jgi:opacity protein-like surface antigen